MIHPPAFKLPLLIDLLFWLLFLVIILTSSSPPPVSSFRFFKSLWKSGSNSNLTITTTTPTSSSTPSIIAVSTSTTPPIPHLAFYLARYPSLNESYLSELVTASPNVTAHVERFSAASTPLNDTSPMEGDDFLEEEEEETNDNSTSALFPPKTASANAHHPINISTYFELGGAGRPPAKLPLSSKPETEDEKPFEVLIANDKTMAWLRFDLSGRHLDACTLYDIEKEPTAFVKVPIASGLQPLTSDYRTLLEAIRRCTDLARNRLQATPGNILATSTPLPPSPSHQSPPNNETSLNTETSNVNSQNSSSPIIDKPPNSNNTISLGGSFLPPIAGSSNNNHTGSSPISGSATANLISVWKGIVPGTKWCGLGDSALDYNDLGPKADVDLCCRAHDHCPLRLKAFRMGYGLINFSFYTKSHCDCDEDFLHCLQASPTNYAAMLRNFYFNVLKVQCLKTESPLVCVKKRKTTTLPRKEECLQYEVSKTTKMKIVSFEHH